MTYMNPAYPFYPGYIGTATEMPIGGEAYYKAPPMDFGPYMTKQVPKGYAVPYPMNQPALSTQQPPLVSAGNMMTPTGTVFAVPTEQSYIENILRLNIGKIGTFYMTYENNSEWNAKIFRGKVEAAGRDHLIISDPETGQRIMLLMVNFDYATFDEPLNYQYPYAQKNRTKT